MLCRFDYRMWRSWLANSQTLRKYEPSIAELKEKIHLATDPVCGMRAEPEEAYSKVEHEGYIICFCSGKCEEEFKRDPKEYLSKMRKEKPTKHEHHH